jgi:carboxymethylenebutenolidase
MAAQESSKQAGIEPARRRFVAGSALAGMALRVPAQAADGAVIEENVVVPTPDGRCDAAFFHPATGRHPGVLIWTDAFGLRPAFREMGRRLAAQGYAVLVPNPYYRVGKAPLFDDVAHFDFSKDENRARLQPLMGGLTAAGVAERDAGGYLDFLKAQAAVDPARKFGAQGYCMGGALVLRTAAAFAERMGAGASFHGGGLVTDKPESPHRLAPRIQAQLYIAIAANDDARQPSAKDQLREAFAAAKVKAQVEVYAGTQHGWCVADMPNGEGKPIYDAAQAERAWGQLLALYHSALG